jgi:DNA polymerase-3 subunit epsilon
MKIKGPFLVVDTETGGLNSDTTSILSIAGVVWEPQKKIKPLFDFYICEDEIITEERALQVNKIDLAVVKQEGLSPSEAVIEIKKKLDKRFGPDRKPIMLVAHNAPFDVGFIKRLYKLAKQDYYADFYSRALDTCSILHYLMILGKVQGYRASADVLFEATSVKIPKKDRHTAKGDALATARALEKLLAMF